MPKIHPSLYEPAIPFLPRNRETCAECSEMATYYYAPSDGGMLRQRLFCDQHVPRGCSCSEFQTDDEGREMPCIEYIHSESGFPRRQADGRR